MTSLVCPFLFLFYCIVYLFSSLSIVRFWGTENLPMLAWLCFSLFSTSGGKWSHFIHLCVSCYYHQNFLSLVMAEACDPSFPHSQTPFNNFFVFFSVELSLYWINRFFNKFRVNILAVGHHWQCMVYFKTTAFLSEWSDIFLVTAWFYIQIKVAEKRSRVL